MLRMLFFGDGRKCDERTNGQTHIGGWVENVTNGRTDEHTGGKKGTHTHTLTESCFLRLDSKYSK